MNFDINERTILRVRHGSHAYGLALPTSDVDEKGVAIEPFSHMLGFLHRFEQFERAAAKGHEADVVIYSIRKFAALAADCNPNIVEVLHVDASDVLRIDAWGEELVSTRMAFLSCKARFTFGGYARSQLKRIRTHRAWLLSPPVAAPTRADFGLPDGVKISASEIGAHDALVAKGTEVELSKDLVTLYTRERAYNAARQHWAQFVNWKETRNPARAELEARFGYDTKHAMHLLRLMRMCREILRDGVVLTRRPDRNELLAVRLGQRDYDSVIEEAEKIDEECNQLLGTSPLPREPNRNAIDALVVRLVESYCRRYG